MSNISWLPSLLYFNDYDNCWDTYEEAIFSVFKDDFIDSTPLFNGCPVYVSFHPSYKSKHKTFWHITSEGSNNEEARTPDFRRCERIGWTKALINNVKQPEVTYWRHQERRNSVRVYIWLKSENFIVILQERNQRNQIVYYLVTAYCVAGNSTVRKLERKYQKRLK